MWTSTLNATMIGCQAIIISLMLVATTPLTAQEYAPNQWYRIRAPHVDLIFKGNMHQETQRIANTLEHLYRPVSKSLGAHPAPLPLIIWNQKFSSNGCFALPPRRVDFDTAPPQDYNFIGTNDWFNILTVHEFRHVVQFAKLNRNFNQLFYWLGGELALSSIVNILVPTWFLEGDAVGIETALTQSGRGRIPYFSRLYKTNLLERGGFPYCKQIFRSFKHEVADHYNVGYYLTTHLRRRYGADVLANILERTTWLVPLPIAVKQVTGKSLFQIYKDANQELEGLWQKQLKGLQLTPATYMMTRSDETYTDYSHPQLAEAGQLVVLKSGLGTVTQFVLLDEHRQEHPLLIPGATNKEVSFSVAQGQMVWTESVPHPRWENHQYSVIKRYDIQKKKLNTLSYKSRYNYAALSPDATKIVAVESDTHYHHRLVILDAANGKVLRRLPNPDNHFYLTPKWLANGQQLVAIKHQQQKATIALVDTVTGVSKDLLPYSVEHIGAPVPYGQYVFYNSAYSGIDNIYVLELESQQRYQVTSRKYGAYNPTISTDGRWIIFNDFTKDGMDVVKMPFDPQQWKPLEEVEDRSVRYYAPLVTQENNMDVLEHVPSKTYPIAPYRASKHLFNLHSWVWPLHKKTPSNPENGLGLVIRSEDVRRTTQLSAGLLYDKNKQKYTGEAFAKLSYKGWYPVFTLEGRLKKDYQRMDITKIGALTLKFPLTFKQGQYTNSVSLSTTSSLGTNAQVSLFQQTYQGQVTRTAKKSYRDLYPPWGQEFNATYTHNPCRSDIHAHRICIQPEFYFPGLLKHHSFHVKFTYQHTTHREFYRWLPNPISGHILKHYIPEIRSIEMNYAFPIYYPDWEVWSLLYVKRLSVYTVYDFIYNKPTNVYQPTAVLKYNNVLGLIFFADVNFLPCPCFTLEIGAGCSYHLKSSQDPLKPIFSVSFRL